MESYLIATKLSAVEQARDIRPDGIRFSGHYWIYGHEVVVRLYGTASPRKPQLHLPEDAPASGYRWTDDGLYATLFMHLQLSTLGDHTGATVQAGGFWHGMVSITLPPQKYPAMFNELVRRPRANSRASEWI